MSDASEARPQTGGEAQSWVSGPRPPAPKSQTNWVRVAIGFFLGVFAGGVAVYQLAASEDVSLSFVEQRVRLRTLEGEPVAFGPTGQVHILNLWLQGCADCMPHFDAWKHAYEEEELPLGVRVTNVAYQGATGEFARRYHVDESLVIDAKGNGFVNQLGVSKFTTFLVSSRGTVCFRGHPADDGFVEGLEKAAGRCQ